MSSRQVSVQEVVAQIIAAVKEEANSNSSFVSRTVEQLATGLALPSDRREEAMELFSEAYDEFESLLQGVLYRLEAKSPAWRLVQTLLRLVSRRKGSFLGIPHDFSAEAHITAADTECLAEWLVDPKLMDDCTGASCSTEIFAPDQP